MAESMADLHTQAIIFDVDGVLLTLTPQEEALFFQPFEERFGLYNLSRDWNSYKIRNDEKIVDEIFEWHDLPQSEKAGVKADYLKLLTAQVHSGTLKCPAIDGAEHLLDELKHRFRLGIATANFLDCAKVRLEAAGLWGDVAGSAFGAEGNGHKHETLQMAITALGLAACNVIYIGDNLNDVEAGLKNKVHFIGFSQTPERLAQLRAAGAPHISDNHPLTLHIINELFN